MIPKIKTASALLLITSASTAYAIDYSVNGFMTVAAGQIIQSEKNNPPYLNYDCPCFITDYNQGGVYEDNGATLLPDSKIGLQTTVAFTPELSFTGQAVARAVNADFAIEWAYLSYQFAGEWTVQVGRKRLPMYFYSDYQDVGNTYIMARPQQSLYGWEVSNYNGISLLYESSWGDWEASGSIYTGSDEVKHSGYQLLYNDIPQNVKWEQIVGTYLTLTREWLTTRLTYIQSKNSITDMPYNSDYQKPATQQTSVGLALNANFDHWFVLSEFNRNERKNKASGMDINAPAISIGTGYKQDKFTYFVNHSNYTDKTNDYNIYQPERWSDTSVTVRYDFDASSDMKFQVDKFRENAYYDFVGDTTLLTLTYDLVF